MIINEILKVSSNILAALFIIFTVLPVKLNYSSIAIISLTILAIVKVVRDRRIDKPSHWYLAALLLPFVIYVLGLMNSANVEAGLDYISRNASFLAFPIIFISLGNFLKLKNLVGVFLIGLAATNVYLTYLFFYYFNFGERFYMVVTEDIYHATYLGMYNLVAYWYCVTNFCNFRKNLAIFFSAFFLCASLMTSTRIIFLLAFFSLALTVFIYADSIWKRVGLLFTIGVLASVMVTQVPSVRQKFDQFRELRQLGFDRKNYESLSSRFGKIEASLQLIKKNIVYGTGTGDLMDELEKEYRDMNFTMGYKYRYNPHNQYLDNLARNGIFGGGLALLCLYILPLYVAIKHKDLLIGAFIVVIGGVSLTESILDVHKGITFYVFFISMLLYASPRRQAVFERDG